MSVPDQNIDKSKSFHNLVTFYFPFFTAAPTMLDALSLYLLYQTMYDTGYRVSISYVDLKKFFATNVTVEMLRSYDLFLNALGLIKLLPTDIAKDSDKINRTITAYPVMLGEDGFNNIKQRLGEVEGCPDIADIKEADLKHYFQVYNGSFKSGAYAFTHLWDLRKLMVIRRMHPGQALTLGLVCESLGIKLYDAERFLNEDPRGISGWRSLSERSRTIGYRQDGIVNTEDIESKKKNFLAQADNFTQSLTDGHWTPTSVYGLYCHTFKEALLMSPEVSRSFLRPEVDLYKTMEYQFCNKILHFFQDRDGQNLNAASVGSFISMTYLDRYMDFIINELAKKGTIPLLPVVAAQESLNKFQMHMSSFNG